MALQKDIVQIKTAQEIYKFTNVDILVDTVGLPIESDKNNYGRYLWK